MITPGAEQITHLSSVRRRACACSALLPCDVRHIAHQKRCCARLIPCGWGPVEYRSVRTEYGYYRYVYHSSPTHERACWTEGTHSRACDADTLKWLSLRLLLLRIGKPLTDLCFVNTISQALSLPSSHGLRFCQHNLPILSLPSPLRTAYELLYLVQLRYQDVLVLPATPARNDIPVSTIG